ncbi:GNAT family N-acetyltransferase [Actinacidiphila paucisporea]|uniref:Protein N-acetyltransferase, RimJ/RimL family n=1 Tax=Actinacidiphila paucisporea TaxID=310782 RepID=A0A1M7J8N0_9ACTN|nr:GNAT family N-acetyltransferase [Actinacidiphila paucisporea]SHM49288.1 Protein N-acetyltransferase, RimJ/RimL family [Actinacidiphila paucisporea]
MTSTFPDISLSTERLVLRPYDEADIPELVEMMNDDLVTAWTGVPWPYTEAAARAFVSTAGPAERRSGRGLVLAVTEMLTQRLVGTVQLQNTDWRIRGTEIGYLTASWARGEGYAGESVLAVVRWLFASQGFERVELRTAADNTASQQVAQKIGCISEGVLRNAGVIRSRPDDDPHGRWAETRTDLLVWSLLPEDLDDADGTGEFAGRTGGDGYDPGYDSAYAAYRGHADYSAAAHRR